MRRHYNAYLNGVYAKLGRGTCEASEIAGRLASGEYQHRTHHEIGAAVENGRSAERNARPNKREITRRGSNFINRCKTALKM